MLRGGDVVEEAGHGLKALASHNREIDAFDDRRSAFRGELPGKTDTVVMSIRITGAPEAVPGKAFMDAAYHCVDAGRARGL